MSTLKLFLLGSPRLERDGVPLEFDTRKNVALIAYLAVTGQTHSRESLITLLWPELEPSRARAGLRRNLSTLKKALDDEWLVVDRETVGTDRDAEVWLDVEEFRKLARAWQEHGHPESELCPQCLPALAEAVELYQGDFLAGFTLRDSVTFDDWQFFQTEGLRQELTSALERLLRGHSVLGAYQSAIPYARRWVALDPLHEPAHRELMRLYAQSGQRAAALRQYRECERMLEEELGVPLEEETTELFQAIKEGRDVPPVAEIAPSPTVSIAARVGEQKHNLPVQPTPFVGRESVLAEIKERLQNPECRLLTLVGPGGSGKTRLALEAGAVQLAAFKNGVFFVSLAPLGSVESIEPTVATALGLSGGGDPREQVLGYLREKNLLLILDNFEHLLLSSVSPDGGESLVTDILKTAPNVKVLVTSRVGMQVRGEHLFPVTGMDAPSVPSTPAVSLADVDQYDAVKLFTAGARRRQPAFELTEDSLTDALRICHLVGGMPLGILMAAAWVGTLTPAEIGDEITQSLDFLEADRSDVPERQRSMRAVFDHSWNLLTERELFAGLSVFRGGFTRQAAQRVAGASLRDLKGLVDRSLVHRMPTSRYEMHELLRQYGVKKLESSPDVREAVGDRHCAYFTSALEQWGLDRPRQQAVMAEMDLDIENARAAWDWAAERGQAERLGRAFDALDRYHYWYAGWQGFGAACETAARGLEGIDSGDELQVLGRILTCWMLYFAGGGRWDDEAKDRMIQRSTPVLEQLELAGQGTRRVKAEILFTQAQRVVRSNPERSRQLIEQSLALYQELDDQYGITFVLYMMGRDAMRRGRLEETERLFREVIANSQGAWTRLHGTCALRDMAEAFIYGGQFERARAVLEERLADYDDLGDNQGSAARHGLTGLAHMGLGQYEKARDQAETALAVCREYGIQVSQVLPGDVLARVALVKAQRLVGVGTATQVPESGAARRAYAEAEQMAQECVNICRTRAEHVLIHLGVVFSIQGMAARGLGKLDQAQQHLFEALQASLEEAFMIRVFPISGIALLLGDAGEPERAVELYALASSYPFVANSRWFEDVFGQHIEAVAATLPPDVAEAARERGRARDLQATVKELLVKLEEWQIPPSDSAQKGS